jgi:hypothetical protein
MHPQRSRVNGYSWLPLIICIHIICGKILLVILVGRVCNDHTEKKTFWRIISCEVSGHDTDHAINALSKYL